MPARKQKEDLTDGRTRRRGVELEDALLEAAWSTLAEEGYSGFTYEAVAARAMTSRPVLYRRWPQRKDLLVAAVHHYVRANPIKVPDTGSLRDDALGFLRNANSGRAKATALVGVQLMAFFRESGLDFKVLRDELEPGQMMPLETIVARAVARHELPREERSSRVINLPFELLRYEMFTTMRKVSEQSILELVDAIWLPLLRARPPR